MNYISVCSGIEAATVAWKPLGFSATAFAEIEPFPCELLRQKYPEVKNYGDITKYREWPDMGAVEVVVGGTPCQSFSVAGKRGGINDIRGQLMFAYLGIVEKYRPTWTVWENVPGVLSSGNGLDFAQLLSGLEKRGYGWAYRVLDAQYFGVPQRRRRVFVVGHTDYGRGGYGTAMAAKVLFEPSVLSGDITPRGRAEQEVAGETGAGAPEDGREVSGDAVSFQDRCGKKGGGKGVLSTQNNQAVMYRTHPADSRVEEVTDGNADTVSARYGTGGGNTPIVMATGNTNAEIAVDKCTTLTCRHEAPIALAENTIGRKPENGGNGNGYETDGKMYTLTRTDVHAVCDNTVLRRLTPIECERLQGFPDNYTAIPWNGHGAGDCPDSLRYKALGNSMAVPVMRWIGERIQTEEEK